jgi:hypothetical protein
MSRLRRAVPLLVASVLAILLPGCLDSGQLDCSVGTVRCGDTCVGTQTDSKNCGACGSACNAGNVCVAGSCVCPTGAVSCNGVCTFLAGDPANCGACGNVCGQGNVCSNGNCFACAADPDGGTPTQCQRTGLIAGCIDAPAGGMRQVNLDTAGNLLGIGALATPSGATFPDALGIFGANVLYSDNDSASVLEVPLSDLGLKSAETLPLTTSSTGSVAGTTQLFVEPQGSGSRLYAMASSINTLRIFDSPLPADAGSIALPGGGVGALGLVTSGGYAFDPGSIPEPFARLNNGTANAIFVPLNVGDEVLRLDVTNPAAVSRVDSYDLTAVIASLPGGGTIADGGVLAASATQAILRNGKVYVALNALRFRPDFHADYGPGVVGVIDPTKSGAAALTPLPLDSSECQNVEWLARIPASGGDQMLVSCAGARTYDSNFNILSVDNTALVLLGANDQRLAAWVPSTAAGAPPPSVGRAIPLGPRVFVADETSSRLYVVDVVNNGFVERVGYVDGGTPPQVCDSFLVDLQPTTGR